MNDDLDTKTDQELDILFDVEVAKNKFTHESDDEAKRDWKTCRNDWVGYGSRARGCFGCVHWTRDAGAMVGWLYKWEEKPMHSWERCCDGYVFLYHRTDEIVGSGLSKRFAHAAVVALLRATRAAKEKAAA